MNLVRECTTTSAPRRSGERTSGVKVLSTTSRMPCRVATRGERRESGESGASGHCGKSREQRCKRDGSSSGRAESETEAQHPKPLPARLPATALAHLGTSQCRQRGYVSHDQSGIGEGLCVYNFRPAVRGSRGSNMQLGEIAAK